MKYYRMRSQTVQSGINDSNAPQCARCSSAGDVLSAARFSKGLPMDAGGQK